MSARKCVAILATLLGYSLSPCAAVSYDSIYWAPPLDVVGTKIVNANGYAVQLKGFATMDPTLVTHAQVNRFRSDWHITILRVPLLVGSGRCWVVGNVNVNASYLAAADSVLKWCRENKIYVLFDGWHEGGTGNTSGDWSSTVAAWRILADRYKNQDHIIWEIFNEPHNIAWTTWVPMAEQLIDTIRSRNPIVKAVVAGTVNWCQQAPVNTLKINRDKVIYSWHPYGITGSALESNFGFIMTSGVAPIFASEWGFTSQQDSAVYGTQLIQYLKNKGASWTGWCYSQSWGPPMLTSENPEVRNPSGNLMYKAYHDTVPVQIVVGIKHPVAGSSARQYVSIDNSLVQFMCDEASPVTLTLFALNGRLVKKVLDQTFAKGAHSVRWNALDNCGTRIAPGLYTTTLKIKGNEYHTIVNIER
jgi:Cellulase (glycosyl hydrolase family 5)